jgi:hypothetical protein
MNIGLVKLAVAEERTLQKCCPSNAISSIDLKYRAYMTGRLLCSVKRPVVICHAYPHLSGIGGRWPAKFEPISSVGKLTFWTWKPSIKETPFCQVSQVKNEEDQYDANLHWKK